MNTLRFLKSFLSKINQPSSKSKNKTIITIMLFRFAWIMGTSIMLSLNAHLRNSVTKGTLLMKVFLRSLALCAIGIILNSIKNNNTVTLRFPGVLQRLALAYLIVASLETLFISTQNRYDVCNYIYTIKLLFSNFIHPNTCIFSFFFLDP